jgi:CheY-like chemotaxis protein
MSIRRGAALSASRAKKRVLIVDDDQNEALLLRSLMQANGYKPLLAGSKPEGVRMAERDKPSCIILNCMMCGEEGVCLYRHFKSEAAFRNIPVIMLSSVSRDILFRFRSMAGAFGGREAPEPEAFLKSPPDIGELVDTVERLTCAAPGPHDESSPPAQEGGEPVGDIRPVSTEDPP